MNDNLATLKDVSAIAGVILSPVIGAVAALWTYRRQQRERLYAAVIWTWGPDYQTGAEEEFPYLFVQNVSDRPTALSHISYMSGSLWRRAEQETAIEWLDPTDLAFPYEIEPAKTRRFRLNAWGAKAITDKATRFSRLLRKFGRAPVWIEIRTMAGTRLRLRAEDATPWKSRPEWLE